MEELFTRLLEQKNNLEINDYPFVLKKVIADPSSFSSWSDIEYVVNKWNFLKCFRLIDKNSQDIKIPWLKKLWIETYDKKFIVEKINLGNSLIIHNWEEFNEKSMQLCMMFDEVFDVVSSAHVYCGLEGSTSFNIHCDNPPNFILQIDGQTNWTVYKNKLSGLFNVDKSFLKTDSVLNIELQTILTPGDILYVPTRMFHLATPEEKRISISFPCWPVSNSTLEKQDKKHYRINY